MATAGMTTAPKSRAVFRVSIMTGIAADVASSVASFVGLEVLKGRCATLRQGSVITLMWIPAVIDVAIEAMRTMEPGAGPQEDSAGEPIRPIVAVRSAVVGRVVEVSVGAYRCGSDVDGNLSGCYRHSAYQRSGESGENKRLPSAYHFLEPPH